MKGRGWGCIELDRKRGIECEVAAQSWKEKRRMREVQKKIVEHSWIVEYTPYMVVALIVAHLMAFVYWIYRVAMEKPPQRRKTH